MALGYDTFRPSHHQQRPTKFEMDKYYDEAEVANLYLWLDRVLISNQKSSVFRSKTRNIAKDFQDGVLIAEILHYYIGSRINPLSLETASNTRQQMNNWYYLNSVFKRFLDFEVEDEDIRAITKSDPNPKVIEKLLMDLRMKIDMYLERKGRTRHEVDLSLALEKQVKDRSRALGRSLKPIRRHSPEKITSLRKSNRTEIPHGHPDRSSYLPDIKQPAYESKLLVVPSSENVPRSVLEEKEMENLAKNETIKILNAKVQSLEQLLRLKDIRLRDLTSQLHETSRIYHITTKSNR